MESPIICFMGHVMADNGGIMGHIGETLPCLSVSRFENGLPQARYPAARDHFHRAGPLKSRARARTRVERPEAQKLLGFRPYPCAFALSSISLHRSMIASNGSSSSSSIPMATMAA